MTGPGPLPVRWWRLRPWNHSRLMRRGDRLEAVLVLTAAMLLVVVLTPIAAQLGARTYARLQHEAALTAATTHPVPAVLLEDATPDVGRGAAMPSSVPGHTAPARWSAHGTEHTGQVPVDPAATAGLTVTVLVDATGELAAEVGSGPDNAAAAVAIGCGVWVLGAGGTGLLLAGVHRVFLAHRLRDWARAWDDYDPGPPPR